MKDHLAKDLKVYVEYTNEYWTTGCDQHNYLINKGADWHEGDRIAVTALDWTYGDPAGAAIKQSGLNTVITLQHGTETWELLLFNTKASTITLADDFIFS